MSKFEAAPNYQAKSANLNRKLTTQNLVIEKELAHE